LFVLAFKWLLDNKQTTVIKRLLSEIHNMLEEIGKKACELLYLRELDKKYAFLAKKQHGTVGIDEKWSL